MAENRIRELVTAMEREIASFEAFVEAQRAFAEAVQTRDWTSLHRYSQLLEDMAAAIAAAEEDRARVETFLRLDLGVMEEGLRPLAFKISEPERGELLDLHRRLRVAVMRARLENKATADYAIANKELVEGVLREILPEKKTRIYGPTGRTVQTGAEALVLDAAL